MLKIANHGGKCCGIKIIHGFDGTPSCGEAATKKKNRIENDQLGMNVSSVTNFFSDAAPAETILKRLDRYIAFIRQGRPKGLIEVTLASCPIYYGYTVSKQDATWGGILEERGFKRVAYFKNSNSGNFVSIYHFDYATNPSSGLKQEPVAAASQAAFPTSR